MQKLKLISACYDHNFSYTLIIIIIFSCKIFSDSVIVTVLLKINFENFDNCWFRIRQLLPKLMLYSSLLMNSGSRVTKRFSSMF